MATDTADRFSPHVRGLTVTSLACLVGVAAGLVAASVTGNAPSDTTGVFVLVGAVLVQFPVLRVVGIDVEEFGGKDYAYIAFMTFALWFVTWGILLTTDTIPF
jgi:hypothetical protein